MCFLVRDLLKRFEAEDFDDLTFEQMAHCFVSEEPGQGADEEKWRKLVSVLVSVAKDAFKAETGITWKPRPAAASPFADEITVYEGDDLLGVEDPT